MAMTAEQKEASKAARSERDRAYRARRKERDAAEALGEAKIEGQFADLIRLADEAFDAKDQARRAEIEHRRQVIKDLEWQLKEYEERSGEELREIRKPVTAAYDAKREALARLERELDRRFPDMTGHARWSAAAWSSAKSSPALTT